MIPPDEQRLIGVDFAARFVDSWNRRDGRAYGDAYWPDAELVDPTGSLWDGREAIAKMHVDLWQGPASSTQVEARVRRTRPLSSTLLLIDLDVRVTGFAPPPPGAQTDPDGAVTTRLKHVVEKRDGEWKILASQNTFAAGPARP